MFLCGIQAVPDPIPLKNPKLRPEDSFSKLTVIIDRQKHHYYRILAKIGSNSDLDRAESYFFPLHEGECL